MRYARSARSPWTRDGYLAPAQPAVGEIAERRGSTPAEVVLRWVLDACRRRGAERARGADRRARSERRAALDADEVAALDALDCGYRIDSSASTMASLHGYTSAEPMRVEPAPTERPRGRLPQDPVRRRERVGVVQPPVQLLRLAKRLQPPGDPRLRAPEARPVAGLAADPRGPRPRRLRDHHGRGARLHGRIPPRAGRGRRARGARPAPGGEGRPSAVPLRLEGGPRPGAGRGAGISRMRSTTTADCEP